MAAGDPGASAKILSTPGPAAQREVGKAVVLNVGEIAVAACCFNAEIAE